ncbi:MAG: RimK family alpha-L-glutamate ligase [Clostridia bacterium]|nr:RimK family alpha-L-glutamate ligase [Clostridia bacterium]
MSNKKGLILVNAYSTLETGLNQSTRLKDEFLKQGVVCDIVKNGEFCTFIEKNVIVSKYLDYDFCIYLDKDKYVSEMLEKKGLKLFNSHNSIRLCDDKMRTYIALSENGIDVVDTIPGALCYTEDAKIDERRIKKIGERLGYPVIVKHNYGSLGQGVFKADNFEELLSFAKRVKMVPHLFQKMVKTSVGKDIRVIVIGGKVFASMMRSSNVDFRSNVELGGVGKIVDIDEKTVKICEKTAKILGLDYCGIDVLLGENDVPIICEVNSNAFFGGIEKVTGKNVAKRYVEHVLQNE